ncbi:MAG: response regulator [Sandaracinaceae bacterium]|nr:response regulator [Sandaracinaceae bacterium]
MKRVLVIEDEVVLRTSVVRGLNRVTGLHVVGAGTLGDALAAIDEETPDLILSDLDLPDRSGVELIGELGRRGLSVPVVFVSAFVRAFSPQIPRHVDVHVLEKPVPLEQLRQVVRERLKINAGATPFGPADYVQLACMGRHSVHIEPLPRRVSSARSISCRAAFGSRTTPSGLVRRPLGVWSSRRR